MLKMFVFWLLLQPCYSIAPSPTIVGVDGCDCPAATNLQKTGKTVDTFSFSWKDDSAATHFEVWYVRENDGLKSPVSTITAEAFTFNNLLPGPYTFYVRAIYSDGPSGFIGIEDLIEI